MKNHFSKTVLFPLLFAVGIGILGCASQDPSKKTLKEYRKMIELQKQKAEQRREEDKVRKNPPMTAEEYERLGDSYLIQGNEDMAFIQYDKALRFAPQEIRIRYKMGRLFLERGFAEEAGKEFQQILLQNPNYALAYEGMGWSFFILKRYSDAVIQFQKAIQLDGNLWQPHHFLGVIHDRQGEFDKAIAHYGAAIGLKPDLAILYNNLGTSLFLKGEYEKAVRAFSEAIQREPSNKKIYNNLALALCKLGRYQEAFEAFKKGGDEGSAYYRLGRVYMIEGKREEAIASFEKAIEINPEYYSKTLELLKKAKSSGLVSRK